MTIPVAAAWGMHGDVGWGWMIVMMGVMVLFWGAVIFGVVWAIRGGAERRAESAAEILDRRFAEGAMPIEEYQARRDVLAGRSAGSNGARKDDRLIGSTAP